MNTRRLLALLPLLPALLAAAEVTLTQQGFAVATGSARVRHRPAPVVTAQRRGAHGLAVHLGRRADDGTRVPAQQRHGLGGGRPQGEAW